MDDGRVIPVDGPAVAELDDPRELRKATGPARLGVLIGEQRWLIDLADSGEVVSVPDVTSVPLAQPWVRGLVNLRGNLFTVIDLLHFQSGKVTPITKESRLLVFGNRIGLNASLLITRMMGLRTAHWAEPDAPPAEFVWSGPEWSDDAGDRWRELRLADLAKDARFLAAERPA